MKKTLTISFVIMLSFTFCKAQYVTIPDTTFANWLTSYFPTCMSGNKLDTTCNKILAQLSMVEPFNSGAIVDNPYVVYVKNNTYGLQFFKNLDSMSIQPSDTGVTGPYPPKLKVLDWVLTNNLHHMASPLPSGLVTLICHDNLLKSLPTLPSTLKYLDCSYNHYYLTGLPDLPASLDTLIDNNNFAYSIPALPNGMHYLQIYWNYISVIPTLPDSLTFLDCGYQFQNLYSIPTLPANLRYFDCDNNYLTSIPALPASLTYLDCSSNTLSSLPNLPPALSFFNASGNINLKCIPVLNSFTGPAYTYSVSNFNISNTQVTCLPNAIQHVGYIAAIDTMLICDPSALQYCKANWNIKGNVYRDDNGDCVQDSSEQNVTSMRMNLYQAGKLVEFRYFQNGNYSFATDFLAYTVSIDTADFPFTISCPSSNDTLVNVTTQDSLISNINFGVQCKAGFDLGVWDIFSSLNWRSRFFPGDTMQMYISAGDVIRRYYSAACGSSGISGTVKIIIDGHANFIAPLSGALTPALNGDTLIYNIADFSTVQPYSAFNFAIRAKTTATIGDEICFTVIVMSDVPDNNPSNNVLSHCFAVRNSLDPNEKEVSPIGALLYPYNNWLTYTIHFQNTGTAAAQNIQVLDTLDTNLNPETFQFLSASFPPEITVQGRYVDFSFANISLPDSADSESGSNGYIEYRIMPFQNLPVGSNISNKASIYFDYNPPVTTNTISNTVATTTGVSSALNALPVSIYPNPAYDQLTVNSSQLLNGTIEITDLPGQRLLRQPISGDLTLINIKSLAPGVYFLMVQSNGGNTMQKFVKQ